MYSARFQIQTEYSFKKPMTLNTHKTEKTWRLLKSSQKNLNIFKYMEFGEPKVLVSDKKNTWHSNITQAVLLLYAIINEKAEGR